MPKIQVKASHVTSNDAYRQVEARNGVDEIDDAVAVTIASWWQSSGSVGSVLAALASGAAVEQGDLSNDISATRLGGGYGDRTMPRSDRMALDALSTWALRRTNVDRDDYMPAEPATTRYASIVFQQGDDARHVLELIDAEGEGKALEYLCQWHQDDASAYEQYPDPPHGNDDSVYLDRPYVMSYSQRLGYAGLAMRVADSYPRKTVDGSTVWACCVSSIGPVCGHRAE